MRSSPYKRLTLLAAALLCAVSSGCLALPDRILEPQFHNPFPQIYRVAVLPFFNQSAEPTVDGEAVAMAYYNELQMIPGLEVMPVGVARQMLAASITANAGREPRSGIEFQRLARQMGVDAVLVGSVTEFSPYYPPRMGLAVDWYAANPSFHPIPAGYGLPWGRAEEEFIPSPLVQEAEFALAREQLKTQTPDTPADPVADGKIAPAGHQSGAKRVAMQSTPPPPSPIGSGVANQTATRPSQSDDALRGFDPTQSGSAASHAGAGEGMSAPILPAEWPDPRGFIPPPPCPERPQPRPQYEPIMSHTRV